jgi:transcriptional regulator with XRE-family HTH domain
MTDNPHPIDIIVGENLRRLRIQAGLSQTELGQCIGVSFQQIQKYENGRNRLAASRLWECAEALSVPVEAFFVDCSRGAIDDDSDANASSVYTRAGYVTE